MRKKPKYIVNLRREEMPFEMALEYHYTGASKDGSGHEGWVFTYEGLVLGSTWGRDVKLRDALFESISANLTNYFNADLVEKFTVIHHIPPHTKEMTHHTDDEIWFTMRSRRWSNEKNNPVLPVVPEWEHPQGGVSSKGVPLHCYMALKRFMKKPENRKKILNQRTAKKFGI
jgi:hypothetical protein